MKELLDVKNLTLHYATKVGPVKAVDGVSFSIKKGETLALVGETGCGKTSLSIAILRLLPRNVYKYSGDIIFDGLNLMKLSDEEFRRNIRWKRISVVPQGALNSLNPVLNICSQVAEPLIIHGGMEKKEAIKVAIDMMEKVGLPRIVAYRYPHELSGGMKQRAIIASALLMKPDLVILDEPTSSLDLMTQANIMNLLKELKWKHNLSYLFITHDLPLASEIADKIAIMYAGKIVEVGYAEQIFSNPMHPYARGLISSVPMLKIDRKPEFIPGEVPSLINPPNGCRFHPRCRMKSDVCSKVEPELIEIEPEHYVACNLQPHSFANSLPHR